MNRGRLADDAHRRCQRRRRPLVAGCDTRQEAGGRRRSRPAGPARAWGLLMADYFDLGGYARPVTTFSAQAQTWFTRGLLWAYAFNHEEAVTCFEHAIEAD